MESRVEIYGILVRISNSISFIFVIRKNFLQILWFNFLNWIRMWPFHFFGWVKLGYPHSDLFNFQSTHSWKSLSAFFLKIPLCSLVTGYGLAWYFLEYWCSYIYMGSVFQVSIISSKMNSYLPNTSWIIISSSSYKCLINYLTS